MRAPSRAVVVIVLTRMLAVGWATWAASTAWAYIDTTPETLQSTEALHAKIDRLLGDQPT